MKDISVVEVQLNINLELCCSFICWQFLYIYNCSAEIATIFPTFECL